MNIATELFNVIPTLDKESQMILLVVANSMRPMLEAGPLPRPALTLVPRKPRDPDADRVGEAVVCLPLLLRS